MRALQVFDVSESFYEPVVDVGPIHSCLSGLKQESGVG